MPQVTWTHGTFTDLPAGPVEQGSLRDWNGGRHKHLLRLLLGSHNGCSGMLITSLRPRRHKGGAKPVAVHPLEA